MTEKYERHDYDRKFHFCENEYLMSTYVNFDLFI